MGKRTEIMPRKQTNFPNKHFRNHIVKFRTTTNLTYKELGEHINMPTSSVRKMFSTGIPPEASRLLDLSHLMGTSIEDLLDPSIKHDLRVAIHIASPNKESVTLEFDKDGNVNVQTKSDEDMQFSQEIFTIKVTHSAKN